MQKVLQMAVLLDVAEVVFQPLLRLDQIPFDPPQQDSLFYAYSMQKHVLASCFLHSQGKCNDFVINSILFVHTKD